MSRPARPLKCFDLGTILAREPNGFDEQSGFLKAVGQAHARIRKVGIVAVVGNEDGAHHCHAEIFQAMNDVGFTVPACGGTYWVGQAMGSTDYKDLRKPYDKTVSATKMMASNAAHLAKLLKGRPYPGVD